MTMSSPEESAFDYDVCLSFANEQRIYVEQVADVLRGYNVKVFYDNFEQAELWGRDLYEYLDDVYRKASRYCVLFASKEYANKVWTNHERRSAQARAISENQEYILPARFDDTEIPGLLPTVVYVDLRTVDPPELARLIVEKLGALPGGIDGDGTRATSVASIVASARASLVSAERALDLHDMLRGHADLVPQLPAVAATNFHVDDERPEHEIRLSSIESGMQTLVALVATAAYWGNEETDQWWFDDIARFAHAPRVSGLTSLIDLTVAPATYLLYAAGVGAACRGRWSLVGRLLTEPAATDLHTGTRRTVATLFPASRTVSYGRGSARVFAYLRPFFVEYLKLGDAVFVEGWERFVYLLSTAKADDILANGRPAGGVDLSHIRAHDTARGEYQPFPSDWLSDQLERSGAGHRLLQSGLCAGDLDRLRAAQASYDARFAHIAAEAAWRSLPRNAGGRGGQLPSGLWYPDEMPLYEGQ